MDFIAMNANLPIFSDNSRPFSHISSSEDSSMIGSMQRRNEVKCNSDPRISSLRADHMLRSIGQTMKRSKSIYGSIPSLCKRRPHHAKSSHNASFFTNGDTVQKMDLLQAMRLTHLGKPKRQNSECNLQIIQVVSIQSPLKTKKNIFFHNNETLSRLKKDAQLPTNSTTTENDPFNPQWKEILDTKDIFKLEFPPCEHIDIHATWNMDRSDSCLTFDSMLCE